LLQNRRCLKKTKTEYDTPLKKIRQAFDCRRYGGHKS